MCSQVIKRESFCLVRRFVLSGCAAVATDLGLYHLFLITIPYAPAKCASFLSGTVVAYLLNKFWTFQRKPHSWREVSAFAILYTITLGLNVGVNQWALHYLSWFEAFLIATGASTIANFLGQKYWVFRPAHTAL